MKYVLGIETSCDDTSCAIIDNKAFVRALVSANQDIVHKPFGGIVPEIASRNHTAHLLVLVDEVLRKSKLSLQDIDGIAVTNRPGLLGSLLVGVVSAKSLALALKKPFIGVHHIEGHMMAPFLSDDDYTGADFKFPMLSLVVSGGHTSLYKISEFGKYQLLGSTIDDAAGEAFDKFAKMIGLGYPGGAQVDRLAKNADRNAYEFPRALIKESNFDFSFSGLKTAASRILQSLGEEKIKSELKNLCASYQEAIVDVLYEKTMKAAKLHKISFVSVTGGVSANSRLREKFLENEHGLEIAIPPVRFCTDNAAMIAFVGLKYLENGISSDQHLGVLARAKI